MTFWQYSIEMVPVVSWQRMLLPDDGNPTWSERVDMEFEAQKINRKQKTMLRSYINRHGINKKLERLGKVA